MVSRDQRLAQKYREKQGTSYESASEKAARKARQAEELRNKKDAAKQARSCNGATSHTGNGNSSLDEIYNGVRSTKASKARREKHRADTRSASSAFGDNKQKKSFGLSAFFGLGN